MVEYPHKSKKQMVYHGRKGYPTIHLSKSGREYIMVRKRGGGTKRLYLKNGDVPEKHQQKPKKRGRPRKRDNPLRRFWREQKRKQRQKK